MNPPCCLFLSLLPYSEPVEPRHLTIGQPVSIYARTYHVLSVDAFTRAFLEREGIQVPPDLPFPDQPPVKEEREVRKVNRPSSAKVWRCRFSSG